MKNVFTVLLVLYVTSGFCQSIGNFSLTNVSNGKTVSLADYANEKGVVIIFVGANCAYDGYYTSRIKQIEKNGKLPVLFINANQEEDDSKMKSHISQAGLNSPYLSDKNQTVKNALQATKSPHVFVLKNTGGKFTLFYDGAIDDNAQVESDVTERYAMNAIEALAAGKNITNTKVRPVGCVIR